MYDRYRKISRVLGAVLFAAGLGVVAIGSRGSGKGVPFVEYTVSLKDSGLRVVSVECRIYSDPGGTLILAGTAGGERVPEPIGLRAFGPGGERLGIEHGGAEWKLESPGGEIAFEYDIVLTVEDRYSPEIRSMLSSIEPGRSRLMGRDIFIVPSTAVEEGVIVDFSGFPGGRAVSAWEGSGNRVIVPSLGDLGELMAALGDYRVIEDRVAGEAITLAAGGKWDFEDEDLFRVVRDVAAVTIRMFGSSPHPRHLFICDVNPVRGSSGYDYYGLHFSRTVLLLLDSRIDRSRLFDVQMSIVAHEFFHNWNGGSVRPADDSFLWFTEGATVYYSYRILREAGVIADSQLERAAERIRRRYEENPLRAIVPIGEAANSDLSDRDMVGILYDGGYLAAEALDMAIRRASGGKAELIDVLKSLYSGNPEGIDAGEEDLRKAIMKLTGEDLGDLIERLTRRPSPFGPGSDLST